MSMLNAYNYFLGMCFAEKLKLIYFHQNLYL